MVLILQCSRITGREENRVSSPIIVLVPVSSFVRIEDLDEQQQDYDREPRNLGREPAKQGSIKTSLP